MTYDPTMKGGYFSPYRALQASGFETIEEASVAGHRVYFNILPNVA